ncbi:MAG: hypothetical protein WC006_02130 [Bacilli bacterium]|nr:hypothetical protein [Bacilli bacterium]
MKYLYIVLLALIGLGIGVFIGLGGFEGIGWVAFIILFPIIYIFGTILLGKNTDDLEEEKDKIKSKWDKYE